jgi:prepilin-type N-terminal cleavage/methylation domain-containing protein
MKPTRRSGFTLLELTVCFAVIALLTTLALPAISNFRKKAGMAREIASARRLVSAYLAYAAENNGDLMPGYGDFPAKDELGSEVKSPVNYRYPWRLAPYVEYDMRVFWGNGTDDRMAKLAKGPRELYIYGVSVEPSLGINSTFVGGDYSVLPPDNNRALSKYGRFCITRLTQATNAPKLIVFASAGGMFNGDRMSGYFRVQPPFFLTRNWYGVYSDEGDPGMHGNVDFRFESRAVAAMLDGHVELLDFKEMDDMRRWSDQAARSNKPQWRLGTPEE